MRIWFEKYQLRFKSPVLTSRGAMRVKNGYFIYLENEGKTGVGECSFIEGLSCDKLLHYEEQLNEICLSPSFFLENSEILQQEFPSIRFGLEIAFLSLRAKDNYLFESDFAHGKTGIPINGLVWMGSADFLQKQIEEKLSAGFKCIKMKVGALDFSTELKLIEGIRKRYSADEIEIRLDANGAFSANDVFEKLHQLSAFEIHSIEQPVQPKQYSLMKEVCAAKIVRIALDEELIGVNSIDEKSTLIAHTKPDFIIIKPSLLGGFAASEEWIDVAEKQNIGWWATSALESNIGLSAIAQWVATKNNPLPQGLGTGGLYENNVVTNLFINQGKLWNNVE